MELALLVYLISILKPIHVLCAVIMGLSIPVLILVIIIRIEMRDLYSSDPTSRKLELHKSMRRWGIAAFVVGALGFMFVPTERTAYMMVGAYTAQKIATDPTVARLNAKVIELIERKIDEYGTKLPTPTAK